MDLLVLPSETLPGKWREQFGHVLVEAMSCEVPVIGSSSGEIPAIVGDSGLIFPEGDTTALARAIRDLVGDPSRRQRLAQAGRRRVLAHFTHDAVADRYYVVYRTVVDGRWA